MNAATHAAITQALAEATSPDGRLSQAGLRKARALVQQARYSGGASRGPLPANNAVQLDQVHPPAGGDYIEPMMAPSRYLVLPETPIVAPAATSPQIRLEFSAGGGWLIGWRAVAVDVTPGAGAAGNLEQATMGVRMFLNDGEELITNGTGADFASLLTIFGPAVNVTPIMRRVDVKDNLFVLWRNNQQPGGSDLQAFCTFSFWREKYPGTG